jgi:hypothetical protein
MFRLANPTSRRRLSLFPQFRIRDCPGACREVIKARSAPPKKPSLGPNLCALDSAVADDRARFIRNEDFARVPNCPILFMKIASLLTAPGARRLVSLTRN